ncbi:hypothetical protein [Haladaptatus halobius]|uniref:hypothetical protein n=1 Tax=Haladaptatus halobius TaxID=2884875 RepID=UPI001D0AE61E|nr:hypothetical protein [Haladaptatus halobius]
MDIQDVLSAAERVAERDSERRETFRTEFGAFENGDLEIFDETRTILAREHGALDELSDALETEKENIDELVDYTEFLTADQAVRHRKEVVEKLTTHNELLWEFSNEMSAALETVESNLDVLENDGQAAVERDPQQHLEHAQEVLEQHNKTVDGLDTNMTILNAYLI